MAISDEERHEIARKLRELPARAVYDMAITLHCLIWPPNITYTGIDQLFARLADLIDRPTCTVVSVIFRDSLDEYEVELSCGDSIRWLGSAEDLAFCPSCGAEVIPHAERRD